MTLEDKFTLFTMFRNSIDNVIRYIQNADLTCPKEVDFLLVDASSEDSSIRKLRDVCNAIEGRIIRVCESSYRTTGTEACNLGLMLSPNRYIIMSASDVVFTKPGWFDVVRYLFKEKGAEFAITPSGGITALDKKIIARVGWFDEHYGNGAHVDCDFIIRVTEQGINITSMPITGYFEHEGNQEERRKQDLPDRMPIRDFTNERWFKEKWETTWPGWEDILANDLDVPLPHPPIYIHQVKRKIQEIDPHPIFRKKFA